MSPKNGSRRPAAIGRSHLKADPAAYDLLRQGSIVLAAMERNGVRIDTDYLKEAIHNNEQDIADLEAKLYAGEVYQAMTKRFGSKVNLDSGDQLGVALFDVLSIPYEWEKTKTGAYKTDEYILGQIDHPWLRDFQYYKKLGNVNTTFLKRILREQHEGYLHISYMLNSVKTYRSSSDYHNLPSRGSEFAEMVRKAFIARPGCRIVENDFAAHEFKIAAIKWADPLMMQYASDPSKDIHRDQAAEAYLCPPDWITSELRYFGKNKFVFPALYGSYYGSMAPALWEGRHLTFADGSNVGKHLRAKGIRELGDCVYGEEPRKGTYEKHIQKVQDDFLKRFPVFAKGIDEFYFEYRRTGVIKMMTGFLVRGVHARNKILNYPVQGPAFHCLLWCLIRLNRELRRRRMKAQLIMQIHDNIVGDVPEAEVQDYLNLIREIVEVELPKAWKWITIPLKIEAEVTPVNGNWYQKAEWTLQNGLWAPKPKKVA